MGLGARRDRVGFGDQLLHVPFLATYSLSAVLDRCGIFPKKCI